MPAAFKSREDLAMSHASLYSTNVFQTLNNPFVRLSAHSFLPESHVPEGWVTVT